MGRSAAPGQTTACSDLSNGPVEGFFTPRVRGRRITLNLVSGFPLLGTRCAGPLDVDLGSALPAVTLSLSRVIHGRLRIDLRGAHRFSAHGFSGVVRSTLVLRLGRAKAVPHSQGSPVPARSQAADPLRTRCPGPELGNHALTSAIVPRSALRRRTFTVALHGRSLRDGPYQVRTRSTLVLTLRRVRVSTQTYRLPSPPSPPRCAQSSNCPS